MSLLSEEFSDEGVAALVSRLLREQASPLFAYEPDGTIVYSNAAYDNLNLSLIHI